MIISSWNVNGIRACIRNGFWDWFKKHPSDIVCLQETKITTKDFEIIAEEYNLVPLIGECQTCLTGQTSRTSPTFFALSPAQRPGYSGVALLSKIKPKSVELGIGIDKFDCEGRTIIANFEKFILVNTYMPNGGPELARIPYKLEYCDALLTRLEKLRKKQENIIVCGDMNVAHQEIDIKNPKANVNNSGFTQKERDWFTKFLSHGYVDVFRHFNPDQKDAYTWWSYRFNARAKNIGWRIDYFVSTKEAQPLVKNITIQAHQHGADHCPIVLTLTN